MNSCINSITTCMNYWVFTNLLNSLKKISYEYSHELGIQEIFHIKNYELMKINYEFSEFMYEIAYIQAFQTISLIIIK